MFENKIYKLSVDDYIIYHKTYFVQAANKKEAVRKFRNDEWLDSESEESTTFDKSVVRKTELNLK